MPGYYNNGGLRVLQCKCGHGGAAVIGGKILDPPAGWCRIDDYGAIENGREMQEFNNGRDGNVSPCPPRMGYV